MSTPYSHDFLNQYSVENQPVRKSMFAGAGIGGAAGGGLGALFAKLAGANPAIGLVGAVPGAILGGTLGRSGANNKAYRERLAAYNNLSPAEQHSVTRAFVNDMNASAQSAGSDGDFEQWQAQDPAGFEQFMLKNM